MEFIRGDNEVKKFNNKEIKDTSITPLKYI